MAVFPFGEPGIGDSDMNDIDDGRDYISEKQDQEYPPEIELEEDWNNDQD